MPDIQQQYIKPLEIDLLKMGIYVVLLNPLQVPPHIYLSAGSELFSIGVGGAKLGTPVEKFIRFIHRGKYQALFIELVREGVLPTQHLKSEIAKITDSLGRAKIGGNTCIAPVVKFCQSHLHIEQPGNFIFELYASLRSKGFIGNIMQIGLEEAIVRDNGFSFLQYGYDEIYRNMATFHGVTV